MKYNINTPKPIGIIGGMGPQASYELYRLLIEGARRDYGAKNNDDYPEILIDSVPVPDFLSNTNRMEEATRLLENRVKRMSAYGVCALTMACNTACILSDRLQHYSSVPIISVIEEVGKIIARSCNRVFILASPTSLRLNLYQNVLHKLNIEVFTLKESEYPEIEYIIRGVIEGKQKKPLTQKLVKITEHHLLNENVDGIVLGCTELPLVFPENYRLPVYSSLDILAKTLLKQYYYRKSI
jgi:aspartate racemase